MNMSQKIVLLAACMLICLSAKAQHAEPHTAIEAGKPSIFQAWPAQIALPTTVLQQMFSVKVLDTLILRFNDSLSVPAIKIMGAENVTAFRLLWGIQPILHIEKSPKIAGQYYGFIMHRDAADSYTILPNTTELIFEKTGMERIIMK